MAAIPVTFQGILFYSDVGVGGGPMPGGPPLGTWGGRPPNYVDIGGPGNQPGIWPGPNPPYIDAGFPGPQPGQPGGGPPLGIWGGRPPNYVDIGGPGPQPPGTPPLGIWGGGGVGDYIDAGFPGPQPGRPGRPTHPIYYPPVIWDPSRPTNPITNPGDPNNPAGGQPVPKIEWKTAWSPTTGWVVIGVPTGEHVTPSGAKPGEAQPKK